MKHSGFTVFELVIVLSIVAILAALAYPSYRQSVMKARRADAQTDLLSFANNAERVFNQDTSYTNLSAPDDTDFYTYTLVKTATSYTITATPTSIQSADSCGTMNLTSTGQKTHSGSSPDCWAVTSS
jgi:type IV pilus assembly protein PilE